MKQQSIIPEKQPAVWMVYIDGASRNNPGKSGAGIFMKKDGQVVCQEGFYLGTKTNNQAEYYALLLALFLLKQYMKADDTIWLASDSQLLVRQVQGIYKVKHEGLRPLHELARKIITDMPIELMHVMRSDNVDADLLANQGIDSKKALPKEFIALLTEHGIVVD